MFKNRIGRQKQGFDASELAIDQRHAELGFIVAVLAQTLDDNGGADLLAVVGDQPSVEETVTFLQPALSRARRITSTLVASETSVFSRR